MNMNKMIGAFLSAALLLNTAQADIVNRMGSQNPFNTQIATAIDNIIGKSSLNPAVSFYETFPTKNFLSLTGDNDVNMVSKSNDPNAIVLTEYISIPGQGAGSALGLRVALAPQDARVAVSQQLAESGLIKTGDILVSTRPQFANSLQYLALQLLATHVSTAVVVTENGRKVVYNIDVPMDVDMLGGAAARGKVGYSLLDSNHFTSDNSNLMLQVLRPRLTNQEKVNMQKWLELALAKARAKVIYPAKISFNSDYSSPMYREGVSDSFSFVADMGRLLLDKGLKANQHLQMYCSEFAWTMLSLKDCDPSTTASDFNSSTTPACVNNGIFFKPLRLFGSAFSTGRASDEDLYGMVDGIPSLLEQNGGPSDFKNKMVDFALPGADGAAPGLSNGHKAIAASQAPLIKQTNPYFKFALAHAPQVDPMRAQLNPASPRNYSPTAFTVHAIMPDVAQKRLDYVMTLKYIARDPKFTLLQSK